MATSAGNTIIWACIRNRYCSEKIEPFKSRLGLGRNIPPIVVYKIFFFHKLDIQDGHHFRKNLT